jgi:hypothetical protein
VRVDFGLAFDSGPVREAVRARLGDDRMADLAGDGRTIGPAAAIRRAGERLVEGDLAGDRGSASELRLVDGGVEVRLAGPGPPAGAKQAAAVARRRR